MFRVRPFRCRAAAIASAGPHPAPGGGWEATSKPHVHKYAPFDLRLFSYRDGCYYFIGDPRDFGYTGPALQLLRRASHCRRLRRRLVLHGRTPQPLVAAVVAVLHRRSAPGTTGTGPTIRSSGPTGRSTRSTTAATTRTTTRAGATSGAASAPRRQSRASLPRSERAGGRRRPVAAAPGGELRPAASIAVQPAYHGGPAYRGGPGYQGGWHGGAVPYSGSRGGFGTFHGGGSGFHGGGAWHGGGGGGFHFHGGHR